MYSPFNACEQTFSRVIETEDDPIACVQEELQYLFVTSSDNEHIQYLNLQTGPCPIDEFDKESRMLYSLAKMQMRKAEDVILLDNTTPNMVDIKLYIHDLLKYHRHMIIFTKYGSEIEHLTDFKESMLKFTDLPENALHTLIAAIIKQTDSTIKQYFHLQLDILWMMLTIHQNETSLLELMKEINYVSYKCYEKYNKHTLMCKCLKSLWLRIQIYCEYKGISFWNSFNTSLECYDEEYALITLQFVSKLQCFTESGTYMGLNCPRVKENVEFFNKQWSLLMKNPQVVHNEHKIVKLLQLVEELLSELWVSHITLDFYYLTWDYYYKKLEEMEINQPYNQVLSEINVDSMGRNSSPNKSSKSMHGYILFIKMLQKHLQTHPNHWNKFKGRIYTKFPPTKFAKLSEQGLYNITLLFFALSSIKFDEIVGKLLGLLKDLPPNRQMTVGTWNIYIHLIKLYLNNNKSIESLHKQFGPLLEEAVLQRTSFFLFTGLVENLPGIFRVDDLKLKQSLLISNWLEHYMKICAHSELIGLVNTLAMIIERTVDNGVWYEYQSQFINHVLTTIKKLNVNQAIIGTVAGLIVANSEGLDDIVEHFTHENIPGEVMIAFFMTLRRKSLYTSSEKRDLLTIKAWFLSWMIGAQNAAFTKEILTLIKCQEGKQIYEEFLKSVKKDTLQKCLKDSEKLFAKNLNLYVYTNVALIFHYCGNLIYNRTTTNCFLSIFVDQFLLPIDVLRGKKPVFISLVESTWHLFIHSLWKLNDDGDPYLERLIKDLTIRYIPYFSNKPNPMTKVMKNIALCEFLFNKISAEYFQYNKAKHVPDEHLFKALTTVNCLIDDTVDDKLFVLYAKCFLASWYEIYMFKNHKVTVVEMIKKIAAKCNNSDIKQHFTESILTLTKRHLSFNTSQYFQVVYMLVKIVKDIVQNLLGKIKDEIAMLECRRGQGFDNHLRQSYSKLTVLCNK